ncbi:hypothetical protein SASPL_156622 [Salvia splendens]|uniref:Uncharacterized protein n=2 Tax=Salvia splendens TaxID=180675 RepID=A0A8X8VWC9_SALSN|nr:uncharacterized protein LOC121790391 isoform X1 [Salvia splendens]KAG6383610.1 hypothetical protein SASPL_156622 [Salvia splendens]
MSKKKATMTLKDFHGGSIPSDLPLPSAPGVTARPVDRGGFDRQMSWGNSAGRPEHRLRPASAGSARALDEKSPFLSHSSHIGRNFDEDERKPLDGGSGPRRTIADESFRSQPSRAMEHKTDNVISGARVGSSPSIPVSQLSAGSTGGSYAGRVVEVHNSKFNNQTLSGSRSYGSSYPVVGGNAGQSVAGSHPNAWGIRKEASSMKEPAAAAWSAPEAETKLAHASALEKISSGRWSSNQQMNPQKDAAVFGHPETEGKFEYNSSNAHIRKTYNRLDVVADSDYQDVGLVVHAERSLTFHGGGREVPQAYDRAKSAVRVDSYEKSTPATANGFQSIQSAFSSESSERPKLKLLPRSKPLENIESPIDQKQRYEQTSDNLHMEDNLEVKNSIVGDRAPERPKLNLKPRFQSHEQLEGNKEVKRGTVFGEARPRELVLKARGVEDDLINYEGQPALRVKEVSPKSEGIPTNQRMAKYSNRRENQLDVERSDSQRRNNKQSEIWRNNKDAEKNRNQQPKQPQDRAPSPETWRKPIEHGKPAPTDAPMRFGKAASAVELAQAFSKSVSDPTAADRASGPRGIPGRNQMPFSRLTGPTPRPQINGY